jgi:hypothetical protein
MNASKILPLLLAPALLLVAPMAEAAELQTSSGSLSEQIATPDGFDFTLELHGLIVESTTPPINSVVVLECSVDATAHDVDCSGTMSLGNNSVPILLSYDHALQKATWATQADISNGFKTVHKFWGAEIMPHVIGEGWNEEQVITGAHWIVFWYPISWVGVWESITGLPFEEFLEIWTW